MSLPRSRLLAAAAGFFGFLAGSGASAAPPAALPDSDADVGLPARDGFYLQATAGLGAPQLSFTVDDDGHANHYRDSRSGMSVGGSLLLGVPLRPGFVLGVGGLASLATAGRSNPSSTNDEPVHLVDVKDSPLQITRMVGGFVDYYPSPTLGWHVQALVGYAQLLEQNHYSEEWPDGIGIMAGVGHDWWVAKHWSIGLLARLSYANTHVSTAYGNPPRSISEHDSLLAPSLEVSFTLH